ncbi:hypothetical protein SDC9_171182 [bioreactor metagenome]|uniref:Uncharacterized protein n=1 Tax=bioreactor metagenome TaxID=1076179 RepID=A0A645GDE6_9ZZZZ
MEQGDQFGLRGDLMQGFHLFAQRLIIRLAVPEGQELRHVEIRTRAGRVRGIRRKSGIAAGTNGVDVEAGRNPLLMAEESIAQRREGVPKLLGGGLARSQLPGVPEEGRRHRHGIQVPSRPQPVDEIPIPVMRNRKDYQIEGDGASRRKR